MPEQTAPYRDLKLDDIKELIDDGYHVVDVREDWEWNRGHLPGGPARQCCDAGAGGPRPGAGPPP